MVVLLGKFTGQSERGGRRAVRSPLLAAAVVVLALAAAPEAWAQPSWEYTPYRIHVWIAVAPRPELDASVGQEIATTVARRAEVEFGAPWSLIVAAPPAELASAIAFDPERVTAEQIERVSGKVLNDDKLVLISVAANPRETVLRVRELDGRTRFWGPVVRRAVQNPEAVAPAAYAALVEAFAPVTRIETGEAKTAVVRLRAGGLVTDERSPARIPVGGILVPIVRNNDRYGKPIPGKTEEVPWTLLQVTGTDRTNANLLNCNVYSGLRAPIRGRVSARKERYALGVRHAYPATQVVVQVRVRQAAESPRRLAGLEVYSKIPLPEPPRETTAEQAKEEERRNPPELLGYTDWRGAIDIAAGQAPLRLLYIKNGGQLLARLPIVPGRTLQQVAEVPDDNPRLQAEGYIKGLSGQLMDLVARRQILAARIGKRIEEKKVDEARQLLEEFRALPSRNDVQRELDLQLRRQLVSPYPTVQAQIDKLYGETRTALGKYLDPELANKLMMDVRSAGQGGGGATPSAPPADSPASRPEPGRAESPGPKQG